MKQILFQKLHFRAASCTGRKTKTNQYMLRKTTDLYYFKNSIKMKIITFFKHALNFS
jgi:hypothetical protein